MYGSGIRDLKIVHRSGKSNANADALSRSPLFPAPLEGIGEVAVVASQPALEQDISSLFLTELSSPEQTASFSEEQLKDSWLFQYLKEGALPSCDTEARKVILQSSLFTVYNGMLHYIDNKNQNRLRVVVPSHLVGNVIDLCHRSPCGGHFSATTTYKVLSSKWWWDKMYSTTDRFVKGCPECAVVSGTRRHQPPPLHPIRVR